MKRKGKIIFTALAAVLCLSFMPQMKICGFVLGPDKAYAYNDNWQAIYAEALALQAEIDARSGSGSSLSSDISGIYGTQHNAPDSDGNYIMQSNAGYSTDKYIYGLDESHGDTQLSKEDTRALAEALSTIYGTQYNANDIGILEQGVHDWKSDNSTNNTYGSTLSRETYNAILAQAAQMSGSGSDYGGYSYYDYGDYYYEPPVPKAPADAVLTTSGSDFVRHTKQWDLNREKFNKAARMSGIEERDALTFWAGEKIIVHADYSPAGAYEDSKTLITKVELAKDKGMTEILCSTSAFETSSVTDNAFYREGTLWEADMVDKYPNGTYYMQITFKDGSKLNEPIEIVIDNTIEYYNLHRS